MKFILFSLILTLNIFSSEKTKICGKKFTQNISEQVFIIDNENNMRFMDQNRLRCGDCSENKLKDLIEMISDEAFFCLTNVDIYKYDSKQFFRVSKETSIIVD